MRRSLESFIYCGRRFARDTRGTITLLILPMFLLLVFATGLAIDLVRYEAQRADLQNALDRGVLAAASLTQTRPAADVVQEYVDSRTFLDTSPTVNVVSSGNPGDATRTVSAGAGYVFNTAFLSLVGLDELGIGTGAAAIEGTGAIEISLVLDISGSMAREATSGTTDRRLDVLRDAASQFVQAMLPPEDVETVSISLVPYSGQVNAGPLFDDLLSGARVHNYSSCVEFPDGEFSVMDLPPDNTLSQTPHFQWFTFERLRGQSSFPFDPDGGREAEWGWCPDDDQAIVPFANDPVALAAEIQEFVGHDGTGSQIGMRWGLALLSNQTQPKIQALVSAGEVDPLFGDRPAAFGGPTQKIIVLMTDGNTRYQPRPLATAYDTEAEREYWAFSEDELRCCSGGNLYPLNQLARNTSQSNMSSSSARTNDEYDRRMQFRALCDVARAAGIRVYTIGFDISVGSNAHSDMSYCATMGTDFYDVDGLELFDAFSQISVDIQKLKLVMQ